MVIDKKKDSRKREKEIFRIWRMNSKQVKLAIEEKRDTYNSPNTHTQNTHTHTQHTTHTHVYIRHFLSQIV
jgi:hypothetical protein